MPTSEVDVKPLPQGVFNGRRHMAWDISMTLSSADGTEEWVIEGLPDYFTVTLFQAKAEGGLSTIKPKLTIASGADVDEINGVVEDEGGSSYVRNDCPVRVLSPCRRLYGNPGASAGESGTVSFRIIIVEGH